MQTTLGSHFCVYMSFQGQMIVLDLYSEVAPQYMRLKSYFGQPFIWCMLHNFGGTLSMYGTIEAINEVTTHLYLVCQAVSVCSHALKLL